MKEEAARPLQVLHGTVRLGQTRSNRIKPNQTGSNLLAGPLRLLTVGGYARRRCGCATFAAYRAYRGYFPGLASIEPDQVESNQIKPAGGKRRDKDEV
jgi:hypothetical protein